MNDETQVQSEYSYEAGTLRGTVARIVQSRAIGKLEEQNEELGTTHDADVPLQAAADALEADEKLYERMCDVLDAYFDDWSTDVATGLGLQDE